MGLDHCSLGKSPVSGASGSWTCQFGAKIFGCVLLHYRDKDETNNMLLYNITYMFHGFKCLFVCVVVRC